MSYLILSWFDEISNIKKISKFFLVKRGTLGVIWPFFFLQKCQNMSETIIQEVIFFLEIVELCQRAYMKPA